MILNAPISAAEKEPEPQPAAADAPSNILGAAEFKQKQADAQGKLHPALAAGRQVVARLQDRAKTAAERRAEDRAAGLYTGPVVWFLCFASFLGLQLNETYGMKAIIVFLAPWLILMMRRIPRMAECLMKDWLLLISPSFATLSALWSGDPQWSMRAGVQYGATIIIGIAAAHLVSRRYLLTSLMAALAAMTVGGFAATIHYGGFGAIHGMIGLYGSKNQFASSSAVLLIGAVYLVIYARVSMIEKLFAMGLVGISLAGIYGGHSAGTLVSLAGLLVLMIGLRLLRKGGAAIILFVTPLLILAPIGVVMAGTGNIFGSVLQLLGKDSTLTGRTDLWATGFQQIQAHTLLGVGYQAFWRIGNPVAERLWALFGIETRTGFNFHNEYINTTVDLGVIGLLISITVLACVAVKSVQIRLRQPETLESAFQAIFLYYFFLTFVEQEFFYQFFLSPIILCLAWSDRSLARRPVPVEHRPAPPIGHIQAGHARDTKTPAGITATSGR